MNNTDFLILKTTHAVLDYNPFGFNVLSFLYVTGWF